MIILKLEVLCTFYKRSNKLTQPVKTMQVVVLARNGVGTNRRYTLIE
jgi:hypothetical protein